MTQEQKDILIKDLCSRLPYGVKAEKYTIRIDGEFIPYRHVEVVTAKDIITKKDCPGYMIRPYLFPLSSMTKEQEKEYRKACQLDMEILSKHPLDGTPFPAMFNSQDWLDAHHFDYRGLIPMNLAIDSTNKNIY